MSAGANYAYKVVLFIDIFACAIVFRDPDITISSETGLAMQREHPPRWARWLNWFLDQIQPGHCQLAIEADIVRAQTAIAYLKARQQ